METAGHLQIQLRDRRRVLSIRRTDLRPQVRLVDLRRFPSGSATSGGKVRIGRRRNGRRSVGILHVRRMGYPGRSSHSVPDPIQLQLKNIFAPFECNIGAFALQKYEILHLLR